MSARQPGPSRTSVVAAPEPSDAELVRRSGAGDAEAFRALFERKLGLVYAIGRQMLGERAAAQDVVQETFLALWSHCGAYREEFAVDTWLRRIATNKAIDHWRGRRRHPAVTADTELAASADRQPSPSVPRDTPVAKSGPGAMDMAVARDLDSVWLELSEGLSPQQRAAFVLKELQSLPTREVAEALGCSASTVRSHLAEARRVLRRGLRARYPEYARAAAREDAG